MKVKHKAVLTILVLSMSLLILACADKDVNAALLEAAEAGNAGSMRGLIQKGADPNISDEYGRTPLMIAALGGKVEAVDALIKAGADIFATAKFGQTALQFATEGGNAEIVELLRSAQAVNPPGAPPPKEP